MAMSIKKAYLAGGCFRGMEDLFRKEKGVIATEVGYLGGDNEYPSYHDHPGHAEGIEITYDPKLTSFQKLLDFFFRIHNPTTLNQQGNDSGSSYRSAIFYQDDEEKQQAIAMIRIVNDAHKRGADVVTSLEPFEKFWPAEEEHQDYLVNHPGGYTCHAIRFPSFLI